MTAETAQVMFGDLAMEYRAMPIVTHTAPPEGYADPVQDALSVALRELVDDQVFNTTRKSQELNFGKRLLGTLAYRLGYFADDCEPPRLRAFYRLVTKCYVTKTASGEFKIYNEFEKLIGRGPTRRNAWQRAVHYWIGTHKIRFFEDMARDLSVWRIRSVLEVNPPYSSGKGGPKKPVALTPPSKGK